MLYINWWVIAALPGWHGRQFSSGGAGGRLCWLKSTRVSFGGAGGEPPIFGFGRRAAIGPRLVAW